MAKVDSYSDFAFEQQIAEASQDYLKFLNYSDAKLKNQLVDVMLESIEHPKIYEILSLLAFVRKEIREYHENSKQS